MGKIAHGSVGTSLTSDEWDNDDVHEIGGTASLEVVRTATYVVAASDAPTHVKAQADYECDGTADDVQIQAAIDALPVPSVIYTNMIEGGGKVLLSGGQFNISSPIEIDRPSMTLEGMGRAQTSLKLTNGADCDVIHFDSTNYAVGLHEVHIKNLQIDGDKDNNTAGNGIVFNGARVCTFENITILRMAEHGFYQDSDVKAVDYATFRDCFVVSCALGGWYTEGATGYAQLHLDNCYVLLVASGEHGYHFDNCGSLFMNGCTYDGGSPGIGIPIYLEHCDNIRIKGAMIYGVQTAQSAIQIINTATSMRGIDIEGCEIQSTASPNTSYAFYIYGTNINDVQLLGNRVSGDIDTALYVGSWASGKSFTNWNIANNVFDTEGTRYTNDGNVTLVNAIFKDNVEYIHPGEVRTASGALTAGNANAIFMAFHMPESQDGWTAKVTIDVTTGGGTVGAHGDVGIADDAAGTNRGTEFFDDLLLNDVQVNDSWVTGDGGTQTKWVFIQDSASATDGWIVGQIRDENAASLAGTYYIEYVGR